MDIDSLQVTLLLGLDLIGIALYSPIPLKSGNHIERQVAVERSEDALSHVEHVLTGNQDRLYLILALGHEAYEPVAALLGGAGVTVGIAGHCVDSTGSGVLEHHCVGHIVAIIILDLPVGEVDPESLEIVVGNIRHDLGLMVYDAEAPVELGNGSALVGECAGKHSELIVTACENIPYLVGCRHCEREVGTAKLAEGIHLNTGKIIRRVSRLVCKIALSLLEAILVELNALCEEVEIDLLQVTLLGCCHSEGNTSDLLCP